MLYALNNREDLHFTHSNQMVRQIQAAKNSSFLELAQHWLSYRQAALDQLSIFLLGRVN